MLNLLGQLVFLCLCLTVQAQKPSLRNYGVADGLANSIVTSIYQDKKGFVWFGTREGLSRFDGYTFVNFGLRDGLGHPMVNSVAEDKNGHLWMSTNGGGVSVLVDKEISEKLNSKPNQKFVSFLLSENEIANKVNKILFDKHNNLWCLSDFGLFRASLNEFPNLKFEAVIYRESGQSGSIIEDSQGRIWLGFLEELFEIKNGQIISHGSASDGARVSLGNSGERGNQITGIAETKEGKLLVSTLIGLYEFVPPTEQNQSKHWLRQSLTLGKQVIFTMFQDSGGALWFGTFSLNKYEVIKYHNGQQEHYGETEGIKYTIRTFAEDSDGNLWLGSDFDGGVYKFSGYSFINYKDPKNSLPLIVDGIFENYDGKIIGVQIPQTLLEISEGKISPLPDLDFIYSLPRASFIINVNGEFRWFSDLWYSTNLKQPVIRLRNGREIELKKVFSDADLLKGIVFYEDEKGTAWFVKNYQEIYRFDFEKNSLMQIISIKEFPLSSYVSQIVSDKVGGLWFGYIDVLCRLREGQLKCFQPSETLPSLTKLLDIRSLYLDSRGWLWVGMRYTGVSVTKNPQDENPQFFHYSDELPSNVVRSITEDNFGRMYFGTERGVGQFDVGKNIWRNINSTNGLSGNRVMSFNKDSKGNIWIITPTGLTKFNPQTENQTNKPPPIYLSHVNIAGDYLAIAEAGVSEIPLIELPSSSNNLSIEFVGLDYTSEDNLRYQYKLEGVDADWSAPTKRRDVNFAQLTAGSYRFLVRAINREGITSIAPASFEFRILPPIYLRWWFLLLSALMLGGIIYLLYKYRLQKLLELEKVRTRIANDLHDDIGANLTRISFMSEVAKQKSENGNSNLLNSIADIARESVSSMNDIVWAIAPEHDSLLDLTRRMRQHAEEVFALREIDLEFHAPAADMDLKLSVGVRRDVLLIFKEAVNNAARHSECSKVSIDFQVNHATLVLRIQDNGKGFTADSESDGQGLRSMTRRAKVLGGNLTIESKDGTLVKFDLALVKNNRI